MASDYEKGLGADRLQGQPPPTDIGYAGDRNWQNGGHRTPEANFSGRPAGSPSLGPGPGPGTPGAPDRDWDADGRRSGERNRPRGSATGRGASGQTRICKKCGLPLTGQFV